MGYVIFGRIFLERPSRLHNMLGADAFSDLTKQLFFEKVVRDNKNNLREGGKGA